MVKEQRHENVRINILHESRNVSVGNVIGRISGNDVLRV